MTKKLAGLVAGVPAEKFNHWRKTFEQFRRDAQEVSAEASGERKIAKEDGVRMTALTLCIRLQDMDSVKRGAFLRAFDAYRDAMNLDVQMDIEDVLEREDARPN